MDDKTSKKQQVNEDIGKFGMWVNDNIVGNPITFVLALLSVAAIYSLLIFMPYAKWNTGPGLFYNTLSSSFELITGVGAVVGVVVLHKKVNNHRQDAKKNDTDIDNTLANHDRKLDKIMKHLGIEDN